MKQFVCKNSTAAELQCFEVKAYQPTLPIPVNKPNRKTFEYAAVGDQDYEYLEYENFGALVPPGSVRAAWLAVIADINSRK